MRRLLSAHVSLQPRPLRAVVRHGERSSHQNLPKMVHTWVSTRDWALRQVRNLTKLVEQRLRGSDAGKSAGGRKRGARPGRSWLCPVGLFPRPERIRRRADRQHRRASGDDGSGAVEAARRAGPLAGGEGKLATFQRKNSRSKSLI